MISPVIKKVFGMELWVDKTLEGDKFYLKEND